MALKNWTLASITADTETDLVSPDTGAEVAIVGLIICNTDTSFTATVAVKLTDSDNSAKGTIWSGSLAAGESVHIDTKLFIAASTTPDKLRVISSVAAVSFLASGDEG